MKTHLNTLTVLTCFTLSAIAASVEVLPTDTLSFVEQQVDITVELAITPYQRERGLMDRTSLDEDKGMLFVFADQAPRGVWMKNTLLPLDVLFLDDQGSIVSMLDNLQPCTDDPCPVFDSEADAAYMVELNADFIENNNPEIGQQLQLPYVDPAQIQ
ncbi:MAG: DUF192 domain-containing protein [Methylomonas sp.]